MSTLFAPLRLTQPAQEAEHGGPMIFAQMGMMQAINRHHKREFNPDRKAIIGGAAS
jgi:hypothetical protein